MSDETPLAALVGVDRPEQSPETPDLPSALVAALRALSDVPKLRPGVHGKYVDLAAVHAEARPVLGAHGLGVLQDVTVEDGEVSVVTEILHVSGQSRLFGPVRFPAGRDAQAAGSAITYARRYGLLAALGMAGVDDDDDGEASVASSKASGRAGPPPGPPRDDALAERRAELSAWQARLADLAGADVTVEARQAFLQAGWKSVDKVTATQAGAILAALRRLLPRIEQAEAERDGAVDEPVDVPLPVDEPGVRVVTANGYETWPAGKLRTEAIRRGLDAGPTARKADLIAMLYDDDRGEP